MPKQYLENLNENYNFISYYIIINLKTATYFILKMSSILM